MTHAEKFGVTCRTCFFFHAVLGEKQGACLLNPPPNVISEEQREDCDYDFVVTVLAISFCQSWRSATDPSVDLLCRIEQGVLP